MLRKPEGRGQRDRAGVKVFVLHVADPGLNPRHLSPIRNDPRILNPESVLRHSQLWPQKQNTRGEKSYGNSDYVGVGLASGTERAKLVFTCSAPIDWGCLRGRNLTGVLEEKVSLFLGLEPSGATLHLLSFSLACAWLPSL